MTTINNRTVPAAKPPLHVSPSLIQVAKLRVTINDKLGRTTDPAIRALAGRATSVYGIA